MKGNFPEESFKNLGIHHDAGLFAQTFWHLEQNFLFHSHEKLTWLNNESIHGNTSGTLREQEKLWKHKPPRLMFTLFSKILVPVQK